MSLNDKTELKEDVASCMVRHTTECALLNGGDECDCQPKAKDKDK